MKAHKKKKLSKTEQIKKVMDKYVTKAQKFAKKKKKV